MKHRVLLVFFIIVGLIEGAIAGQIVYKQYNATFKETPGTKTSEPLKEVLIPRKLIIDGIGLTAEIEPVGVDKNGHMEMPSNPWLVGWYKYGATLEEKGNIVIGGHLDSKTGPAIFYRLASLAIGDEIIVVDQKNEKHSFFVIKKETYDEDKFPSEEIFAAGDKKRLNLITCRGRFDRIKQGYNKRIVVFTEPKNN